MKKILLPLMAVAALLTACDEERYGAPQLQKGVTFTVPDFVDEAGTRVAVTIDNSGANFTWTEGDTLGVFPSNGYQTAFPISGGAGTNTAVFDGADWALRPNASYAAYYPFVYEIKDKTAISVSYLGQTQDGNGSTAHLGDYDYLAAKYATVSSSGDVNFTLNHLGCLVRFQLTIPEADTYTSMTLSCDGSMLTTAGKYDLTAATPALTAKSQNASISLALDNVATIEANEVLILYMMFPPMDLSGKNLSIKVSGEKDYTATVAGKDMKAGCIYVYTNSMALSSAHEYVDLGLSVLWATCNVGATQPEEYGDYFAWGEVETKSKYYWDTYQHCNGDFDLIKYCTQSSNGSVDNLLVLDSGDDAAARYFGEPYRTPTLWENKELYDNCVFEWTSKNNIAGCKITGPNGNSIFLPAGGYFVANNFADNTVGQYWSSSLSFAGDRSSYVLYFTQSSKNFGNFVNRSYGLPIRPVCPNPDFIRAASIQITGEKTQLAPSETLQLSATVAPSDATNASVTWSSSNTSVATVSAEGLVTAVAAGSVTITATANDGSGVKGEYEITVAAPALMHNGHEYVDLGLPSGTMWATCNVGASAPEEYGVYFAWGETTPKTTYDWSSYFDTMDGGKSFIKYNNEGGKTSLESTDDAATSNWGGSWRMPTKEEWSELHQQCDWELFSLNGILGYMVVSSNGNSIFLPASGHYEEDYNGGVETFGDYWSSSLVDPIHSFGAYYYKFKTSGNILYFDYNRSYGRSVRSVFL